MKLWEIIMIALAMACDIFAQVIAKSSSYAKIDRNKLLIHGAAFGLWELVSLTLGHFSVILFEKWGVVERGSDTMELLAVIIVLALAVRMIMVGFKHVDIIEHRIENIEFSREIVSNIAMGIRTYFLGVAFSACHTDFISELAILTITAIAVVVGALYVGYHYGFGLRNKSYLLGAVMLIATDAFACCSFFA